MRIPRTVPLAIALAVAAAGLLLTSPAADAHERRTVAGTYTFVVGWLEEPAISDVPNGLDVRITNAQSNQPVEGAEQALKADVTAGGQTKTYELRARFNMPGAYTATLIPTRAGAWTFRIYGTLEGRQIDERFESGPGRFNDVEPMANLQFPSAAQSAGGSENETAAAAAESAQRALDEAESARTTGIAVGATGIAVGLIGLGVAVAALRSRGGQRTRGGPAEPV